MARGWESKSVEAQQAESFDKSASRPRLSPEQAAHRRNEEALRLARTRLLHQLQSASSPGYRKLLEETLQELEAKLKDLQHE